MKKFIVVIGLILLSVSMAAGQCAMSAAAKSEPAKTDSANSAFKTEYFAALGDLEKKIEALADAAPQEKYSWKPGEGVRSVGEVFMHMAAGNYSYARATGATIPTDINPREFEKSANDKAKTVAELKKSFAFLRQTAQNLSDSDLNKTVKLYGKDSTVRNILLISVTHQSEHLGQSIAYAREIGVVPPWTVERQAAQKAAEPKK
jgi:uncharacterized damage-inducible protein DinB